MQFGFIGLTCQIREVKVEVTFKNESYIGF